MCVCIRDTRSASAASSAQQAGFGGDGERFVSRLALPIFPSPFFGGLGPNGICSLLILIGSVVREERGPGRGGVEVTALLSDKEGERDR